MENTDYSKLTTEELITEEKKLKRNEIYSAGGIGFLIGIIAYGLFTRGFGFLYVAISLGLMYMVYRNSKKTKEKLFEIREELNRRSS